MTVFGSHLISLLFRVLKAMQLEKLKEQFSIDNASLTGVDVVQEGQYTFHLKLIGLKVCFNVVRRYRKQRWVVGIKSRIVKCTWVPCLTCGDISNANIISIREKRLIMQNSHFLN